MNGFKATDSDGDYYICECDGAFHDTREAADACCADRFAEIPDMSHGYAVKKQTAKQLEALSFPN